MIRLRSLVQALGLLALISLAGCAWFPNRYTFAKDSTQATTEPSQAADAAQAPAAGEASSETQAVSDADSSTTATSEAARRSPGAVVEDFYTMHRVLGSSGLPAAGSMNAYDAFVCPDLAALMDGARARQERFIADHPGDKPPLIEGDLFSSLFEGPDSVRAEDTVIDGNKARVLLDMRYSAGEHGRKWQDTVLLEQDADGIWCIADVEYQGDWQFANHGRLSDALKADH